MLRRNVTHSLRVGAVGVVALSTMLSAAPSTPVADAAMQGNRDAVRTLLKQAADVNAAQGDGMTALHWAAMKDDAELVQTLLFADANSATSNGTTALKLAAASGNAEAVQRLIDGGAQVNAKEPVRGLTPAMFAAASNRAAVLTVLARNGADLKATSKVTDLSALSKDPAALREITFGNPAPPGEPPAGGRNGPVPQAGGPGVRGGRGGQIAGVDRNYQLNELV